LTTLQIDIVFYQNTTNHLSFLHYICLLQVIVNINMVSHSRPVIPYKYLTGPRIKHRYQLPEQVIY